MLSQVNPAGVRERSRAGAGMNQHDSVVIVDIQHQIFQRTDALLGRPVQPEDSTPFPAFCVTCTHCAELSQHARDLTD